MRSIFIFVVQKTYVYWGELTHWSWFHDAGDRQKYPMVSLLPCAGDSEFRNCLGQNLLDSWKLRKTLVCVCVCVECISTWMRSVPIFSQWAKSQIFLEFLFACCTSDVFSPFSSSTVVECFSQANNSQPSGYVTQVLRVSRPLGANCPEKSKAFVGQLALNPESSHCLARNQRIFKEHLHGTLWMLIKGTLYKWAKARRTRNSRFTRCSLYAALS